MFDRRTAKGPAAMLRDILKKDGINIMPCCFDGISARLIEDAGFPFTFMSGFAVSVARLGLPDAGLISYGEMLDQGMNICSAVKIPVIGDGDTGYGNAVNVKRTVQGYARAGFASVMIEDQVWPKRCGHTKGKQVVEREEAFSRIRAAVDARDAGPDILILARTDALETHGMEEAIERAKGFSDAGADILFVEAPRTREQMEMIIERTPGIHLANMVEKGLSPLLSPGELEDIGYKIAAYPLTLLSSAMKSMKQSLELLKQGRYQPDQMLSFEELKDTAGFNDYYKEEEKYTDLSRYLPS